MTPPNEPTTVSQTQKDFFDDASFKTLYGGVVVTWVATSAIADVWSEAVDLKVLGFTIAIIVALIGFFLSEQRTLKKLLIAPFNGLLIYLTIMGGTSFLPANIDNNQPPARPDATQVVEAENTETDTNTDTGTGTETGRSAFFKAWNPNSNLVREATQLKQENQALESKTRELQQVNTTYETQLQNTREVIRELQVTPDVRENLMKNLDVSRNATLRSNSFNQ